MPVPPRRVALAALAEKYETLVEIHRALAAWDDAAARARDRAVATRFPGALRELQTLPLDELEARARALRAAADGGPVETWMTWMADYHALLATAMAARRAARSGRLDDARVRALVAEARAAGAPVDETIVHAAAGKGRLSAIVCGHIGARAGLDAAAVEGALFRRRRRP